MPRILHAADLHLSDSDREYGLAVFSELIEAAGKTRVDYLVFCGDLFNTFADAEKLRVEFRRILGTPSFEFLYLPGNHEELQRNGGDLSRLDWGAATILQTKPFQLLRRDRGGVAVEFLAVPHQEQYAGYADWAVPRKEAPWRIAMAHGVVAGMSYRGPDDEGGAAALDPDLFLRFRADYAALGHIHGRRGQAIGGCRFEYPGSTRVWRRNESGPRGALLLELPETPGRSLPEPKPIPLASAGEYRHYVLPLTLEGEIPDVEALSRDWRRPDHIELELTGLVEDERAVSALAERLRVRYAPAVRILDINRDAVSALPGIASQPLVRRFLEAWESRMPRPGRDAVADARAHAVWNRAREMALNALKAHLERAA
jgi:DNA repair exonuclease SbcCD nuclease subunit